MGLDISSLKVNHNSKPRNHILADACFKAGYIDAWGRGTLKIINSCREAALPEPEIVETDGGFQVSIFKGNQVGNQVSNQVGNQERLDALAKAVKKTLEGEPFQPSENSIQKHQEEAVKLSVAEIEILKFCQTPQKRKEILEDCLGVSNQTKNFNTRILPLINSGFIKYTIKDKPHSQHQKYVITTKGKVALFIRNNTKE